MILSTWVVITYLAALGFAGQPSAPEPIKVPLRDLKFGDLNFLHTTDIHAWFGGHLLEASYAADWGDYIDFARRLREKLESEGRDLLLIDTGDRIEGNGLYDASEPKNKYLFDVLKQQHIDVICSGNHELYKQNSSETEYLVTVPAFRDNYLASNLQIHDPVSGKVVALAPKYKKFTTKQQGIRITAFGFIFDFQGNSNNTVVQPVEETVRSEWFRETIRDQDVDLFLVIGHSAVRSTEFNLIFEEIRKIHPATPIQFFGGHYHIRDYVQYDANAFGLASGRFMETIGFQSIQGIGERASASHHQDKPTFFRKYIDNNLFSFYHHSGHNSSTFHTEKGRNTSEMIFRARSELRLDQTFGCAPKDLWMSRARYPSNDSVYTWLEKEVFPQMIWNGERADVPRLVLTNTGAIRFDIFKGAFTRDSTYIVCPFTSGFHYLKDVPYDKASKILRLLNMYGQIASDARVGLEAWRLLPPEHRASREDFDLVAYTPEVVGGKKQQQSLLSADPLPLIPGYTTKDDAGDDGDDTVHSPISFYNVPNCIQATINPAERDLGAQTVDVVFNEFLQPWVLLALRFLGVSYSQSDVEDYMPGETMTSVIADWVSTNWAKNC